MRVKFIIVTMTITFSGVHSSASIPPCAEQPVTWIGPTQLNANAAVQAGADYGDAFDAHSDSGPINQVRLEYQASTSAADEWTCFCPTSGESFGSSASGHAAGFLSIQVSSVALTVRSQAGGNSDGVAATSCECPDFQDKCSNDLWRSNLDGYSGGVAHFSVQSDVRAVTTGSPEIDFHRGDTNQGQGYIRIYDSADQLLIGPRQSRLLAPGSYRIRFFSGEGFYTSMDACEGGLPLSIDLETTYNVLFIQAEIADLNCDGAISVGDIAPFVLALVDPVRYAQDFPACDLARADTNCNGVVNVADISGFVSLLALP